MPCHCWCQTPAEISFTNILLLNQAYFVFWDLYKTTNKPRNNTNDDNDDYGYATPSAFCESWHTSIPTPTHQLHESSPPFVPALVEWRKEKQNETDKIVLGVSTFDFILFHLPPLFFSYSPSFFSVCFPLFELHPSAFGRWFSLGLLLVSILFRHPISPHHVSLALNWLLLLLRTCSHAYVVCSVHPCVYGCMYEGARACVCTCECYFLQKDVVNTSL